MKVLSIDLDYIMGSTIDLYSDIGWHDIPSIRWKNYYDTLGNKNDVDLYIDEKNLFYCFDIFLNSIRECGNVHFAFNHDSILDELYKYDSIELINIDHHDDVIYPNESNLNRDEPNYEIKYMMNLYEEYESISKSNILHEGNWISFLNINKKISSYTFIGNSDSIDFTKEKENFIKKHLPKFEFYTRDQYTFKDFNFDYIFVCLSPQYIPPCHWHYFSMFLSAYKSVTGKNFKFDEMPIRKFSTRYHYSDVMEKIGG